MTPPMRALRVALIAASTSWVLAMAAATAFAGSAGASNGLWPLWSLSVAVYVIGGAVCHQLPERSFHYGMAQLPVCARCTGIYVGAAIAALWVAANSERGSGTGNVTGAKAGGSGTGITGTTARRWTLVASALPTAATLVVEWTTGTTPGNWVRAVAGLPLGVSGAWLAVRACGAER